MLKPLLNFSKSMKIHCKKNLFNDHRNITQYKLMRLEST